MLQGEILRDNLHLNFRGVHFYQSSSTFCIHQCLLNLLLKSYHDLLTVCSCDTSISKTHQQNTALLLNDGIVQKKINRTM